jgi:serine/threonine protein phosphatase PrpC
MPDLDFAFYTDIGGRKNNEDAYLAKKIGDNYLFVVADGLGGHGDGELASKIVVDSIKECFIKNFEFDIRLAIEMANKSILSKQIVANSNMKSTVALVYITPRKTYFANVGDTRIYAFKADSIVFQSVDHSASQLAVRTGEITTEQIRNHPDRNMLLRALGATDDVKVDITEFDNADYDSVLLCSDGFWEYVLEEEMTKKLSQYQTANTWLYNMRLLQLERARENCDNNTAIVVVK